MQSGNVEQRSALAQQHEVRGQHVDQHRSESSGQKHQAAGIDGKSLTELLAHSATSGS